MKMKKEKMSYENVLIKECIPKRNEIIPMIKSILDNNNIPYEINSISTEIQIKNTETINHELIEKTILSNIPIAKIVFMIMVSIVSHKNITYIRLTAI